MKRVFGALLVMALLAGGATAQQPQKNNKGQAAPAIDQGNLPPELLLYLQEVRRNEDPKQVVRRNAAERGAQRRNRLAARKWFGFSNTRPTAAATPFMGTYSPMWVGNTWNPYFWSGVGYPHTTLRLEVVPDRYRY